MNYCYSITNLFKSFVLSHYTYCNLSKLFTFNWSPLMTSIIFHIRGPKNQEDVCYIIEFHFSTDVHFFAFCGAENHVFHIFPIRSRSYVVKGFGCMEVSNRVSNWNKRKNPFNVMSILQIRQLEIPVLITEWMSIICIFSLFLLKIW